jgi:hypothetical protein
MWRLPSRPRLAWVTVLPVLVAGCGGGTAPRAAPELADAVRTAAQLDAISAPTVTPVFRSFLLLAQYFAVADSAPVMPTRALALPPLGRWFLPQSLPLPAAPRGAQGIAAAIFPPGAVGKTFVWDTTSKRYVASSDPGAPANGVRFVVYATPPQPGIAQVFPSIPLTPIGYVDLTDRSAAGTTVLGVTLVATQGAAAPAVPTTYADYTLGGPAGGGVRSSVALAGFAGDGVTRLDLTSTFTSTLSAFDARTTADLAGQDAHMVETVSVAGAMATAITVDFSLQSGSETVRALGTFSVDTTARSGGGSFAVTINGRPYATVTFGLPRATYTPAPGVTLDAADDAALEGLVAASFGLFGLVLALSIPGLVLGV